jgi:hypothetical protein
MTRLWYAVPVAIALIVGCSSARKPTEKHGTLRPPLPGVPRASEQVPLTKEQVKAALLEGRFDEPGFRGLKVLEVKSLSDPFTLTPRYAQLLDGGLWGYSVTFDFIDVTGKVAAKNWFILAGRQLGGQVEVTGYFADLDRIKMNLGDEWYEKNHPPAPSFTRPR